MSKETYSELAYNYIKQQIMENNYSPGIPLNESDISEKLHMSRTPVRNALKKLEEEGLVRIEPYKGAMVNVVELNMMGYIQRVDFVRNSFLSMMDYAERKIIKIDHVKLESIVCDIKKAYSKGDIHQSLILENHLYRTLIGFSTNQYFKHIILRTIADLENYALLEVKHNLFSFDYVIGNELEYFDLIVENLKLSNYKKVRELINELADKITINRVMNHSKISDESFGF